MSFCQFGEGIEITGAGLCYQAMFRPYRCNIFQLEHSRRNLLVGQGIRLVAEDSNTEVPLPVFVKTTRIGEWIKRVHRNDRARNVGQVISLLWGESL